MRRNRCTLGLSAILALTLAASPSAWAEQPDVSADSIRKALGLGAQAPVTTDALSRKSRELREQEGHVFFDQQGKADASHFLKAQARDAAAQPPPAPQAVRKPLVPEKLWLRLGKSVDGRIKKEDFRGSKSQFRTLDVWGRGYITVDDLKAAKELGRRAGSRLKAAKLIQKLDKNGDRKISRDEFPAKALKLFELMDANRDGVLTFEEVVQYLAKKADAKRAKKILR
jgi:Ca2+-binding EF-hand superfamily protein